jgi:hypothetical protein
MPPIVAFIVGVLSVEIAQLGLWWTIQKGPTFQDYFRGQTGHFFVLLGASLAFCTAWKLDGLTQMVAYLPEWVKGDWIASGFPYTPQVGLIAGGLLAFRGIDKIVAALKGRRADVPAVQPGT